RSTTTPDRRCICSPGCPKRERPCPSPGLWSPLPRCAPAKRRRTRDVWGRGACACGRLEPPAPSTLLRRCRRCAEGATGVARKLLAAQEHQQRQNGGEDDDIDDTQTAH